MCSWHLARSYEELTAAMVAESIADYEPAAALLAEGARALDYDAGNAGYLATERPPIRRDIEMRLGSGCYRHDELLSFLSDAVARSAPEAFAAHIAFLDTRLVAEDSERTALASTLAAIRQSVLIHLGAEHAAPIVAVLDGATIGAQP